MQPKPTLLQAVRQNLRLLQSSPRTEQAYVQWIRRFIGFHGRRHPRELGVTEIQAFLVHLAVERRLAAATVAQARAAVTFLYRRVLDEPMPELERIPSGRRPTRLPVVLSRAEVGAVLARMEGVSKLVALLLYGGGLRLLEALTLRVKDVDLERGELRLRRAKGAKDRVTVLPEVVRPVLVRHLERVRVQHQRDLADGSGRVALPAGPEVPPCRGLLALAVGFPGDSPLCGSGIGGATAASSPCVGDPAGGGAGGPGGGIVEAGQLPHPAPQLRHAPPGERGGHPDGAGAVGSPGCLDDDAVYPCAEPGRAGGAESGGPPGSGGSCSLYRLGCGRYTLSGLGRAGRDRYTS